MRGIKADRRKSIRERLIRESGPFCALCGKAGYTTGDPHDPMYLTLGHIVARVDGGTATPRNFQLEHRVGNTRRGQLTMLEVRARPNGEFCGTMDKSGQTA